MKASTSHSLFLLFLIFSSLSIKADENVSFGPVYIAQHRMELDLDDFKVNIQSNLDIQASFQQGSLQWIRSFNNVLMPRAILKIKIKENNPVQIQYNATEVALSKQNEFYGSDLYISLLSQQKVNIFKNNKQVGAISLDVTPKANNTKRALIDYTCAKNQIEIKGLEDEYISIGCQMTPVGKWHGKTPHLQIAFAASNIKLLNGGRQPFVATMTESSTIQTEVLDKQGKIRQVTISARLPKRVHRLLTAWGSGPYGFSASDGNQKNKSVVAPTLFLYGKYDLMGGASLKFFNATVYNKALFNNFGFYFSYLLADAMDKRFEVLPLLGAQTLTFRLTGDHKIRNRIIYPQGFEFSLKHALGIQNNTMVLGMFIYPAEDESYTNMWFRFGRGMFWELNLISWKGDGARTSTWGLSFGLPLAGFF